MCKYAINIHYEYHDLDVHYWMKYKHGYYIQLFLTHLPNLIPSSIDSGSFLFSVSGNNKQSSPAVTEAAPNITNGRAWPNLPPTKSPYNIKSKNSVLT